MKIKVYVLDLEIPARTKRRALLVGIPLGVLLGTAAIVYANVPNVFKPGDVLSSSKINQNFSSLDTRVTALEGAPAAPQYAWSWEDTANNVGGSATNQVASMTFTPPAAGFAIVTAHFGTVVRNQYDTGTPADCHVGTQLSLTAGQVPDASQPGFSDIWINGNLPTENGGGTYLDFNSSVSIVIPVTAAATTVWLNGQMNVGGSTTGCAGVLWRSITMTAVYVRNFTNASGQTY
jgi:hypothetical protein